jgi:hypothetical protein
MCVIPAVHGFGADWVYRLTCIFLFCSNNKFIGRTGVC